MALPTPVLLRGVPGSPYTRKMLALLRYRHIPYRFLIGSQQSSTDLPQPKVYLLPTFYLPNAAGELEAVVDSTPLIRRFEAEFSDRSVIPSDPVVAFFDYLLEDYADEWLTKAMFHYRWYYESDIKKSADILPRWTAISEPEDEVQKLGKAFSQRQISRLYVVGSNDTTAPVIEASYQRCVNIMKGMLEQRPFLLGNRPGAADFGMYGQLTQLAGFDPTPMDFTLRETPRVFAWIDIVDDLSGLDVSEEDWLSRDDLKAKIGDLLSEVGRVYAPAMLANADALMRGADEVTTTIDGKAWTQQPFPYQGKCLQWLGEQYAGLAAADREVVNAVIAGTGCEALFSG